ncbi:hypothetical protein [Actinoallomurus acaciae]|uniref:Uncharacterized protein n=1 Tax=Actinoallomurus acaciae TaxID=502577 RepID=A0ABV5YGT9_9ACTN
MSVPSRSFRRRRFLWPVLGLVVAASAVAGVAAARSSPAPPRPVCCKSPPVTSGIEDVPRRWEHAVARRDARAAWALLTPEAQRRYGSVDGLRAALAGLTPGHGGPATWRLIDTLTQGSHTPSAFLYLLIEDGTLRPRGAVVVHSMADGAHDGRVDPGVADTVRIREPAAHATVSGRPRMRTATGSPPAYVAVQAGGQTHGSVGAIRGADGMDSPFDEALKPGPTLVVAVDVEGGDHFAYGSVPVTVR